jgi:hypothetical protein
MDRNGEGWSGDEIASKAEATARREGGTPEELANAEEGADPQRDIEKGAGRNGDIEEHMTPHPGNDADAGGDRSEDSGMIQQGDDRDPDVDEMPDKSARTENDERE